MTAKRTSTKRTSKRTAKTPTKTRKARVPPNAKAAGERAVAVAKAKGAVGRNVTIMQRQLRDSAIVARATAGWSTAMIAEEFEITDRQVRRVLADERKMPSGLDDAPIEILEDMLRSYRGSIADFQAMAYEYRESHPNVALGAKRAADDARDRYAHLLTVAGKLPENLELFRAESVLRRLADEMIETMERVEVGEMTAGEAGDFFRSLVSAGSRRA
jgi:predicted transcriptional regulator